jgi:hypothetical protein
MERIGLVGLPNAGKSSLFNALTGASVPVATHPFTTTESTVGVAHIADPRLHQLAVMSKSKKVVEAGVEIVDIAGLAAGAEHGEGLGNRFLAGIREVDALCLVLRGFADDEVAGEDDPVSSLSVLELELVLADLEAVESALTRARKVTRVNAAAAGSTDAMEAAQRVLSEGLPLYRAGLDAATREALAPLFLLTNKPFFCVVNLDEDHLDGGHLEAVAAALGEGAIVLGLSVRLEAEASLLDADERVELLEGLGLGEGALVRVARALFDAVGRRTFFTTGEDESRAWTFRAGARAPECAGAIHSDLQRGFIRAEVIWWEDLIALGSWGAAKTAGKLRIEGKDYVVADGDVLEIRFNV